MKEVCGCNGDGLDTGENSYTNFSSAWLPKINISCCMLREKGRDLSLILLLSRTNSTKCLCHISAGIQMSKILTDFSFQLHNRNEFYLLEILTHTVAPPKQVHLLISLESLPSLHAMSLNPELQNPLFYN